MRSTTDDGSARAPTTATASAKIGTRRRTSSAWAHARPDSSATSESYRAAAVLTSTYRRNQAPDHSRRGLATYLTIAEAQFRPHYRARPRPARTSDNRSQPDACGSRRAGVRSSAPTRRPRLTQGARTFFALTRLYGHLAAGPHRHECRPGRGIDAAHAYRSMKMAFEGSVRLGPNVWFIRDRGLLWENADG
jgi:hypothetical protein